MNLNHVCSNLLQVQYFNNSICPVYFQRVLAVEVKKNIEYSEFIGSNPEISISCYRHRVPWYRISNLQILVFIFRLATIRSAPTGPRGQNGVHAVQLVLQVFKHGGGSANLDNLASMAVWDNSTWNETASQATALGPLGQNSVHAQLLVKEEFSRGEATNIQW